ncbi:MAG: ATP-binding protein [Chloroflexota bacterium]
MNALLDQIFTFLAEPNGVVFYHYALVFAIGFALYASFTNWRSSEFPQVKRTMFGLGLLLLAQFFLFGFSALGREGLIDPTASLPPLDRAFTLFSILMVIWLWNFPEPSPIADFATALVTIALGLATFISLQTWNAQSLSMMYNLTLDETIWQGACMAFLLMGALTLLLRRPDGYWNGIVMMIMMFAGHAAHLLFLADSNYSGILRLAYMAAFPILLALPQRFPMPSLGLSRPSPVVVRAVKAEQERAIESSGARNERRKYSTDPKTFHAMLALAAETAPSRISQTLARAIAQTMLADLCFLIYLTDNNNQLIIASGYDLIREETLEGGSLNKSMIPMLANSIQRGRPLRMPASSTSADIRGLGEMLGLPSPGHLICVPTVTPEKDVLGGVMLLSPYSNRLWSAEDQAFLSNIAISVVPIIQRAQQVNRLESQSEQARHELDAALERASELETRNQELIQELEARKAVKGPDLAAMRAVQEESQRIIEQLQQENLELRADLRASQGVEVSQVEKELRVTLEQVAHLQNQLADANMKVLEFEKGQASSVRSTEQAQVIASISQELRQPMSSIIGYTDLLLGESVGILGSLQRKFVERIKASIERINNLVEDMIQLNTLETGLSDLKFEPADLNLVIDNAMSYTSSQVREKNISIHLDLPKRLTPIYADREALQQILVHLLQNAGAATPVEGSIKLKVEMKTEEEQDFVLIQVSDSGGGIPPEDLPRVFTRLYRADNVLIQGVGDTGVGLSIARTLVEAQQGRIWVESEMGIGSTFSVLLPVSQQAHPERPAIETRKN